MSLELLKSQCPLAQHATSRDLRTLVRIAVAASLGLSISMVLYVASPGIRNYVEYGGVGILVFDIEKGYKFVRRIPTWDVPEGKKAENVKGIAANAATGRVYVTSLSRMTAIDAVRGRRIWDKAYKGGCDRMAISPDGKTLYVPQLEGASWHVVNAATGDVITTIQTKRLDFSRQHHQPFPASDSWIDEIALEQHVPLHG